MSEPDLISPARLAPQPFTEARAWSGPGVPVLAGGAAALVAGVAIVVAHPGSAGLTVLGVLLILAAAVAFGGLTPVIAGEARVVQLFGRYRGTVRAAGLHWVNPVARRRRVSTRFRNHETSIAKVN